MVVVLRREGEACWRTRQLEREGVEEPASPLPSPPSSRPHRVKPHRRSLLLNRVWTTRTTVPTVGRHLRFSQRSPFRSLRLKQVDLGTSASHPSPPTLQGEEDTSQVQPTAPPTQLLPSSLQERTPPPPPALQPSLPSLNTPTTLLSTPPTVNPNLLLLLTPLTPPPNPTPRPQEPPPSLLPLDASPRERKLAISFEQPRNPSSIDRPRANRPSRLQRSLLLTERSWRLSGSSREARSRSGFRRR